MKLYGGGDDDERRWRNAGCLLYFGAVLNDLFFLWSSGALNVFVVFSGACWSSGWPEERELGRRSGMTLIRQRPPSSTQLPLS